MRPYSQSEVQYARAYLKRVSANFIPPALAAFNGLGSSPFRLYKSIAFDNLHLFDLGLARTLPDFDFKAFMN